MIFLFMSLWFSEVSVQQCRTLTLKCKQIQMRKFLNVKQRPSLCHRCNLTPVSHVCVAAQKGAISLFCAVKKLNELLGRCFEFPFKLIGSLTMAYLKGQSQHILKSWYTGGGLEQGQTRPDCFTTIWLKQLKIKKKKKQRPPTGISSPVTSFTYT